MVNKHNILSKDRYTYDNDDDNTTTVYSPISFTFEDPPTTPPRSR
jgi:hypothetical protein